MNPVATKYSGWVILILLKKFLQPAVMVQKRYNPETFYQTMASTKQDLSSSDAFVFIFELFLL